MKASLWSTLCIAALLCAHTVGWAKKTPVLEETSLYFIKNQGQIIDTKGKTCPDVEYVAESKGMNIYFSKQGVSYVFVDKKPKREKKIKTDKEKKRAKDDPSDISTPVVATEIKMHKVGMKIVGANPNVTILPSDQIEQYCNYYHKSRPNGIERVPVYRKLVYQNVYNNIDIVFYRGAYGIKYDIIVRPGGRVSDIRLKYSGANTMALAQGALRIETSLGTLEEKKPFTYQQVDTVSAKGNGLKKKKKKEVQCAFRVINDEVRFDVEGFDASKPLVIDPDVVWSTYVGGSGDDAISSTIAIDAQGNIVVRGETASANFPVSTTASQTVLSGANDAFIAKFSRTGQRLWATYYGGSAVDSERRMGGAAIDNVGNVFFTGSTQSSSGFLVPPSVFQSTYGGGEYDAYLVKLDKDGALLWATYYGGSGRDIGYGLTTDDNGNVFMVGETESGNGFPHSTTGVFQPSYAGGNSDGFLVKFSGSGQRQWCTFIGGNSWYWEMAYGVVVDNNNDIVVTGMTQGGNFPVTTGTAQASYGGGTFDAFVVKLNQNGGCVWSTYYGGSHTDAAYKAVIDSQNNIIICGATSSTNFPVQNAFQSSLAGGSTLYYDVFVVKLNSSGQKVWATYYGGNLVDLATGIALGGNDNVFICGFTESTNFPVTNNTFQQTKNADKDAFLIELNASGQRQWATFFGGSGFDNALAVTVDEGIYPIIAGFTQSTNLSISVAPFQPQLAGGYDAFITKFGNCTIQQPTVVTASGLPQVCTAGPSSVTLNISGGTYSRYLWSNGATTPELTVTEDGTYWVTVFDEKGCGSRSDSVQVDVP